MQLGHLDHPEQDGAGQMGPFNGHRRDGGKQDKQPFAVWGKGDDDTLPVPGIDNLQYTDDIVLLVQQREGEDTFCPVVAELVEFSVEPIRAARINLVDIRQVERTARRCNVTGNAPGIDGNAVGGTDQFITRLQSGFQGFVLGIGEIELAAFAQIDGTCLGIDTLSGPGQYLFQEQVEIVDLI